VGLKAASNGHVDSCENIISVPDANADAERQEMSRLHIRSITVGCMSGSFQSKAHEQGSCLMGHCASNSIGAVHMRVEVEYLPAEDQGMISKMV
jgi:hypothetical protein